MLDSPETTAQLRSPGLQRRAGCDAGLSGAEVADRGGPSLVTRRGVRCLGRARRWVRPLERSDRVPPSV